MDVRECFLKHPRLIADFLPRRRLIGPNETSRGPSVPSAQDGDMVRTKMGREALGKVQGVRRFARAAQFEVAHHKGGKGALLAAQDAHIIKGVTKVQVFQIFSSEKNRFQANSTTPLKPAHLKFLTFSKFQISNLNYLF